jgi:hypothetical protein
LVFWIVILIPFVLVAALPAQGLGVVAYWLLRRHASRLARKVGVLVPALFALALFGVPCVQSFNAKPDRFIMFDGMIRFIWIMLTVMGTIFNLALAAWLHYLLRRRALRRAFA